MTHCRPLYARSVIVLGQRCTRVRLLAPSGGEADGTGAVAACGNLAARPEDCTRELADSVKPRFAGAGGGTRTPNLLFTRQLRCRLRHASGWGKGIAVRGAAAGRGGGGPRTGRGRRRRRR